MDEQTILSSVRASIAAPAGCGKTHLIAETLKAAPDGKPILVLTHTNAGVAALRNRLDQAAVARSRYRISTIDGWAMKLVKTFPGRSGQNPDILDLKTPRTDYPAIRAGSLAVLANGNVGDLLKATYARLIVDEYQDCGQEQHAMVAALAQVLPTCVLGDDMQAIFGWGGNVLVDWSSQVVADFPSLGTLTTPWRWTNARCGAFGEWLLQARTALQTGQPIDLLQSPDEVTWTQIAGENDMPAINRAAYTTSPIAGGGTLIVCDSRKPARHRTIASQVRGATVVENADLTDFISFAASFRFDAPSAPEDLIDFAGDTLVGVGPAALKDRLRVLLAGTGRTSPSDAELAILEFARVRTPQAAVHFLVEVNKQAGVSPLRPSILRACLQAMNGCDGVDDFFELAVRSREQARVLGRSVPKRAVGSTLLLKGLEADVAVVVDADQMDARNLYVAMTRGARRLVVCSKSPILHRALTS